MWKRKKQRAKHRTEKMQYVRTQTERKKIWNCFSFTVVVVVVGWKNQIARLSENGKNVR